MPIGNDQANETTTNLLVNAMLTFIEHPAAWERLRANRELVPSAIEEVLRYRSPVQSMFRVAKRDVHVGGETLPEGGARGGELCGPLVPGRGGSAVTTSRSLWTSRRKK